MSTLISRKADYAMKAVQYLSSLPKGKLASINQIARGASVPREFLAKILLELTTAGVLNSFKGVFGGYRLVKSSNKISLLDVIEAVDGPVHLNLCTETSGKCCSLSGQCPMRQFWISQERVMKANLAKQKLSKLAD